MERPARSTGIPAAGYIWSGPPGALGVQLPAIYGAARQEHWESSCRLYVVIVDDLSSGICHWAAVIGHQALVICHWVLVIGHLSFGNMSLEVGHWKLVIGCWSLEVGHGSLDVCHWRKEGGGSEGGVSEELICIKSNNPTLKGGEICKIIIFLNK